MQRSSALQAGSTANSVSFRLALARVELCRGGHIRHEQADRRSSFISLTLVEMVLKSFSLAVLATVLCLAKLSSQSPLPANTSKASPWAEQRPAPTQRTLRERNGDAQYTVYSDDSSDTSSSSEYQPSSSSAPSLSSTGKNDDRSTQRNAVQRSQSPSSSRGYSMSSGSSMTMPTPLDLPWQWSRAHPAGAASPDHHSHLYPGSPQEYMAWTENQIRAPETSQDRLLRELVHTSHSSEGRSGSKSEPEVQSVKPGRRNGVLHLDELPDMEGVGKGEGEKSDSSWSASEISSAWQPSVDSKRSHGTRGTNSNLSSRVLSRQRPTTRHRFDEEGERRNPPEQQGKAGNKKRKTRFVVLSSSTESSSSVWEREREGVSNAASTSRRRQRNPRKYTKGSKPRGKQ